MDRRAVVVVAPKSLKYGDLPGAEADANNYFDYLRSPIGGAWEREELTVLRNPSRATLDSALKDMWGIDYVFLAFSGHGYHARNAWIDETRLLLNDAEEISASQFTTNRRRECVVVDACRKVEYVPMSEGLRKSAAFENSRENSYLRVQCRQQFDEVVKKAEEGRIEMYSSNLDEAAGERPWGGLFTYALLDGARTWAGALRGVGGYTLTTRDAFHIAAARVRPRQNPQYQPGRRLGHFPFGVMVR